MWTCLDAPKPKSPPPTDAPQQAPAHTKHANRWLCCAACGARISHEDARIEIEGQHEHTFANPHGYLYKIGCFSVAPGCAVDEEEVTRWTWFEGHAWSVAACRACGVHLGWRYRSERPSLFFGLILARLAPERDPQG